MTGLCKDVLMSRHAEAQRSAPAASTSSPAGNTATNGASKSCQPTTSSPHWNLGQQFTMSTASTASSKTAALNSFQPTTSSPLRNSGESSTPAPGSAVSSQIATHVSTQPATSSPLRNSGVSFTIAPQSTPSSQTAAPISAQQTPQGPPRNPVQLFTLSTASTAPTPTASRTQTQSSSSTVQGAVPIPQAPPKSSWQAFSFTNFRDTSAGSASTSGAQNVQPQTPQQQQTPLQKQEQPQQQQASQQPPAASVSDEMDDVTPSPPQLRPQQTPQQAVQPAPVSVQQAFSNDNMDLDEAPKSPPVRPSTHPLRSHNSPARLRNAIPRIQQARRIAMGAITKVKHVVATVNTVLESKDEALAKKLWKSFTSLDDLDTHKGLKRAAKILLRMLALARRTSVALWDVDIVEMFLGALPMKGVDGLREFAGRIVNLIPVTKERKDGVRAFNKTGPSLGLALQQVDTKMSTGWVLNGINNALKPVYAAAAQLRFRMKAGEEELFDWDAETMRVFEEVVGFLGSLGQQANTSVRNLLEEVKYAAKQIFALLFTGIGEVMSTPW